LFDKKLVTIFSAPNYCGTDGNAGSVCVMKVSGDLEISFITLKPRLDANRLSEEKRLLIEKMLADSMAKSPDPYSRLLTSKKATRNKGANFDDSNLIGPPSVPGKMAATVDMDLNERDNEKPSSPSQLPSFSPYPDPPQEKQEFINGLQADKKDTSFNNTLNVLPPEKSDTTPSPWYPKSTGISASPANIQAADSATSKPDMVKNSVSDAENFTSSGTTAEIEAIQHTAATIPLPQLLLVPPTSKLTTIIVSKDDSSKQAPTELRPKNITDTEGSSMSISDCIPPPPATTGQPRSVEEATKDAIESTRTPSRPHPKSPNDIISATENALKNQK
uniref:Protein-serine/threonine phosphatase n=1 Tax=Angiostrongylus cantonensis TaxID=6313 RepID=A0A0K0DGF5_ANGCA